jgi:DNA-binding XRE family transcriptional regulator
MSIEKRMAVMILKIKQARINAGLTSAQLADAIGISRTTLWTLENKDPASASFRVLALIQERLNIKDLFDYEPSPEKIEPVKEPA